MNRTQWILVGLLAVQLLLLAFVGPGSGSAGAGTPQALLPMLEGLDPVRIRIDEDPEKSVVLEKSGNTWVLPETDAYPASGQRVDDLIGNLEGLRVRRPIVSSSRYHETLKVAEDDNERRVRIWADGADPVVDLFLGTSSNYRVSHVRLDGDDEVFEVRGLSAADLQTRPNAWIEAKLVTTAYADITGVRVNNEHGTLELAKDDLGNWGVVGSLPAGRNLDTSATDSWIRSLGNLRVAEPAGRVTTEGYGLDTPVASVEIDYSTPPLGEEEPVSGTVMIRLGALATEDDSGSEGRRYAALEGSDHAVVLGKWDAEKIVDKKLEDLLENEEGDGGAAS
jgi:hypothetical protein